MALQRARPFTREVLDRGLAGILPGRPARSWPGTRTWPPPGSYVVISCGRCDDEALCKQLAAAYTASDLFNHAPDEVAGFLADLELVPPRGRRDADLAGRLA